MGKYFEALFEPVRKQDGLIVDLKGDSILAIWKAAHDEAALRKHAALGRQYAATLAALAQAFDRRDEAPAGRRRILARQGGTRMPVDLADIAYFLSADKLTFLVTHAGRRALVDQPLATLESELDPGRFFRLNRNLLAAAAAIRRWFSSRAADSLPPLEPAAAAAADSRLTCDAERVECGCCCCCCRVAGIAPCPTCARHAVKARIICGCTAASASLLPSRTHIACCNLDLSHW